MWPHSGRRAGAAQVEQTPLEAHLLGVLPQRLPDGADFTLAVGQRGEGTRVKRFPVAVAKKRSLKSQFSFQQEPAGSQHLSRIVLLANNLTLRWLHWMRVSQTGFNYHGNCIKKWNNITGDLASVLEWKDGLFLLLNSVFSRNNDKNHLQDDCTAANSSVI